MATSEIDTRELRNALGAFMTGVTVVTTVDRDGAPRGFTANSFTSVSLNPPLVLFCIAKTASSCPIFSEVEQFAVNILTEHQRGVSSTFASRIEDRFANVDWRVGQTRSPILPHVAAWFDCRLHDRIDAGDHLIVIGRVVEFAHTGANPLGYCRGNYVSSVLEHQALEASRRATCVGAILERQGHVLLVEDLETGNLRPPRGDSIGRPEDPGSLMGGLKALGVEAEIGFLFSVFEDDKSGDFFVYYRGEITSDISEPLRGHLYPLNDLPWSRLSDAAVRSMLERYVNEQLEGRFGIYVGDLEAGQVQPLGE